MVYYRSKNIKGHNYWYLQESYREGNKVKTRTLAYIGKVKPTMGAEKYYGLGTTSPLTHIKLEEAYLQVRKDEPRFSGLVPIPRVKRELRKLGYTNEEEINQLLLDLEKKRIIDLQVAYSGKPEGGFWTRYSNGKINYDRGYVYSIRWRDKKLGTTTRTIIKEEYDKLAEEHYARGGVVDIPELRNRVKRRIEIKRSDFDTEIIDMSKEGEFDLQYHFQPTQKEVKKGILQPKGLAYSVLDREKVKKLGTTT